MGYMRHHAIVVTSWNDAAILAAHARAVEVGCTVTDITPPEMGYRSFLVAPDGSKEGWEHSDLGNVQRERLIEWLDSRRYEDGSTSLDWVEVQFGDDDGDAHVTAHNDDEYHRRPHETTDA